MLRPSLYVYTLRHLRAQQVSSRLLRRINGRTHGLKVRAPLSLRPFSFPAQWLGKSSQTKGSFTFLNLEKDFPAGSIDWRSPEMPNFDIKRLDHFLNPLQKLAEA